MTFKAEISERVMWELSMAVADRDILVEWLRYALAHFEDVVCDSEAEDIIELIENLGVPQ